MKLPIILLVILSSFAFALPLGVQQAAASAVRIFTEEAGVMGPVCSGAVVELEVGPRVVSAGHCALPLPGVVGEPVAYGRHFAEDASGKRYELKVERKRHIPAKQDYVVFSGDDLPPALSVGTLPPVGGDVYLYAGPQKFSLFLAVGYVAGVAHHWGNLIRKFEGYPMAHLNVDGGSSGGIILDSAGRAVGIVSGAVNANYIMEATFIAPLPK